LTIGDKNIHREFGEMVYEFLVNLLWLFFIEKFLSYFMF
jgi:hypothetical protein